MHNMSFYGCEDVTPYGFVSLMDLYESNYIKLKKLIPDIKSIESPVISRSPGHLDLFLTVVEKNKYTTTFYLSYCFETDSGLQMEPNFRIRVYHDARLAEVMAGHLHHGRLKYDHLPADALKEKWRLNRFLNKWLGYCLRQGHSFAPFVVSSRAAIDGQIRRLLQQPI
ncbi:MAG: DUF1249 domain-containing protein [Gammaproteobacteria bacterium]|nr:DUF1249 domain-containing protein [Gammaproteobacteria bacterium]